MRNAGLFRGRIKYKVSVENTGVFLNYLKRYSDVTDAYSEDVNTVCFTCFSDKADMTEKCINSCGGRVILKKISLAVALEKMLRRRVGLVAGFVLSLMVVFASTFFVWDIRVKGNESISDSRIVEMLSMAGFERGMLKKRVDVEKIANRVLINEDALSWIAINFEGTVATAEVKEAARPERVVKKENVNIIASHNGIVMRVDALDGGAQVAKGDTVVKGQLLISSFVKKRTGGSILKGAKGFVWAETKRHFGVVVPLEYHEKKYTGRREGEMEISFLGKKFLLPSFGLGKFEKSDSVYSSMKLEISEKYVLPIEVQMCECREYELYSKRRTNAEALEIARQTAKQGLNLSSANFKNARVDESYNVADGKLVYECTFEGVENIAEELEFELL